jgi:hypothetical protein
MYPDFMLLLIIIYYKLIYLLGNAVAWERQGSLPQAHTKEKNQK